MGCYNSCIINANVDAVWQKLSDFHDLSFAVGVVECVEKVGDVSGKKVGARRILNGVFHETLLEFDEENHFIRYSIDEGPDAIASDRVNQYRGEIRVLPVTLSNQSFVEWRSNWKDAKGDVAAFCNPIYQALLTSLVACFD